MIKMEKVSFRYENGERGVFDIDLTINQGECVVLTGISGSGKTTVLRLINGLTPQYYAGALSGEIKIEGKDSKEIPFWERGKYIGSIFQEPQSQFFSSELAGEIAFGCENYGFSRKEIIFRTEKAIRHFGLGALRESSLDVLSGGEKQRIAIASVYAMTPKIYVCDEPTANLDEESAKKLSLTFKKLKEAGHTLVIAEHRLSWLQDIADRYIYIKDGKIEWDYNQNQLKALKAEELVSYGLKSFCCVEANKLPMAQAQGSPLLEARNISFQKKPKSILKGISFSASGGQVVAITGNNGAGKTTLATILSGLRKETSGELYIGGKKCSIKERRKKIWYSANDTGTQFFTENVYEELFLHRKDSVHQREVAQEILKKLRLYELKDAHPFTLSGGEKQRLSIACGLISDREILIFDEPTSGLDGYNEKIISEAFRMAARKGKVILIITHDNELIRGCCSHSFQLSS